MQQLTRAFLVLPALALAACATSPTVTNFGQAAPSTTLAPVDQMSLEQPAQTISNAAAVTDVSAFVDPTAFAQLGSRSKAEVADAQFKALQFGRVGAPRAWQGDEGQSGSVTVGPYVRVNLIDCRDFTNTVTIGGQSFVKKGTACREADGSWTVSAVKVG
jgi:surface antigen